MVALAWNSTHGHMERLLRWSSGREGMRFSSVLGLALLIRLILAPMQGYGGDLQAYVTWGFSLNQHFWHLYSTTHDAMYPPLTIYLFGVMTWLYTAVAHLTGHQPLHQVEQSARLIAFMRLPFIAADLATISMIYAVARRVVSTSNALLAALAYGLSPAIFADGPLWGQTDGIIALGILTTLLFALRRQGARAGIVLALTILVKPQPVIFVPLVLLYLYQWCGRKTAARFMLGMLVTALLVCFPYLLPPRPEMLAFLGNLMRWYNTTSIHGSSAFNLWWLLGMQARNPWSPYVGMLTPIIIGVTLFAVLFAIVMLGIVKDQSPQTLLAAAALLSLGSFDLMTGQLERYVYPAVGLFLLAGLYRRRYLPAFVVVGATMFLNFVVSIIRNARYAHPMIDVTGLRDFLTAHPVIGIAPRRSTLSCWFALWCSTWRASKEARLSFSERSPAAGSHGRYLTCRQPRLMRGEEG